MTFDTSFTAAESSEWIITVTRATTVNFDTTPYNDIQITAPSSEFQYNGDSYDPNSDPRDFNTDLTYNGEPVLLIKAVNVQTSQRHSGELKLLPSLEQTQEVYSIIIIVTFRRKHNWVTMLRFR